MASVLITGGAGFVGSHLARAHAARRDVVHVIARPKSDLRRLASAGGSIRVHEMALDDELALARIFSEAEPQRVYHLGVQTRGFPSSPLDEALLLIRSDLANLVHLMKAAAEAPTPPRVLLRTGSLAENGAAPHPYVESTRERPLTPYAAATLSATHFASTLSSSLPYSVVNARLTLVYGPEQSTSFFVPHVFDRCFKGEPIIIHNPEARRDLLYIQDAIEGLMALADGSFDHADPINICTGTGYSMREVAEAIVEAAGADPALVRVGDPSQARGAMNFIGSPALAERLAGWRSKIPFRDGIERMIREWNT